MTEAEQPSKGVAALTRFARFRQVPFILQAYVVFVIAATILGLSVFFVWPLHRAIVPYTGGNLVIYQFSLYLAFFYSSKRYSVYGIVWILLVAIGMGLLDMALAWRNPTTLQTNPNFSLEYATFRPVVTIVVPLAWALLLVSPMMRKWINESHDSGAPSKQHQFALVDLLYATMVVAVCLTLSIALVEIVKQKKASLASAPSLQQGTAS